MLGVTTHFLVKTLLILLICAHISSAGQPTLAFVYEVAHTPEQAKRLSHFESYEALRAWHATDGFNNWGFDKEFQVDLNGDRHPEVFLLADGHSHWGDYHVYTRRNRKWIYLGIVRCGANAPVRSTTKRSGWHGFSIDIEHSRGLVTRTFYHWDAATNEYVDYSTKTISPTYPEEP